VTTITQTEIAPAPNDSEANRPLRRKRSPSKRMGKGAVYVLLVVFAIVSATPFVWTIMASFKSGAEIRQFPPTFIPENPTLDNYRTILSDPALNLGLFYRNSAFIAIANVIATLFTSSLLGFIFAKHTFKGSKAFFWFILSTMMIPFQVTMIPGYLILLKLNLLNNLWGLVLPTFIDAFGIFLMTQFAKSIPNDLLAAARVDGASEFRIYRSIVLPQLKPALATLAMLTFMTHWNAYLWPLIVLTEQDKRTLPIILTWYSNAHTSQLNLTMAASVLIVLPVLALFAVAQRWIVRGITLTGIK
jgi:ABC-type glycerol-3-phosphate transport system permease component